MRTVIHQISADTNETPGKLSLNFGFIMKLKHGNFDHHLLDTISMCYEKLESILEEP